MKYVLILVFFALIGFTLTSNCSTKRGKGAMKDTNTTSKVVYDFWAPWCGPCRIFAPTFERWKKKYENENVSFKKVNIDEAEGGKLAEQFRISSIPTIIVTVDGKEVFRSVGAPREEDVAKWIR